MPYNSKAIANYFLDAAISSGQPLTQMKLQKLVYFSHGWSLGLTNAPLINEVVQAWSYGPVIFSLYKAFRDFGSKVITEKAADFVQIGPGMYDFEKRIPSIDDQEGGDSLKPFLSKIWEVYGVFSGIQLSNLTHAVGTPWHQVASKHNGNIPKYEVIPDDLIAEYFRKEAKRNEQSKS